ncbi:hypothetical protein LSG31_22780 [Fodinisporobacter ferrooxydans]|uniref:Uncharacterized protein n=1 Tax=Fodinisporobacter ferrooxydans TaxID=2901836 RepID=A0ABY4CJE7_9BACL|nr:hypothetical protein LSG31_22780 [Alicyclobacillaceae bacterium MYW30-H2]
MEQYFEKMKEYLNMETEISFAEFRDYYNAFIEHLKGTYESLDQDQSIQALFVIYNLESNCEYRAKRKDSEAKKYKKMQASLNIWSAAMRLRLNKQGLSEKEISERLDAVMTAV